MIRNLKVLGLALVAVLTMGAVATSVASAQGKLTSDGPLTLTGTETGPTGANTLTLFNLKIECPGSTYTGHKVLTHTETTGPPPKAHELIPSGATTVTLTPHYKQTNHNCFVDGTPFKVTIDMNGCDYVLHIGGTTVAADTYGATIDIVCPPNQEITVTFWTNTDLHTSQPFSPFCVIHIPPQVGLAGLHLKDTTNGFVDFEGTVTGLTMTRTANPTHLLCPHTTIHDGKLDIDVTAAGYNAVHQPTAISLSH